MADDASSTSQDDKLNKHLIFLLDGTWNSAANRKPRDLRNVFRLNLTLNGYDENNVLKSFPIPQAPAIEGFSTGTLVVLLLRD